MKKNLHSNLADLAYASRPKQDKLTPANKNNRRFRKWTLTDIASIKTEAAKSVLQRAKGYRFQVSNHLAATQQNTSSWMARFEFEFI